MEYVDVFISHQKGDQAKARALKHRIEKDLKFSCYLDAADDKLKGKKKTIAQRRALAERIRQKLRNCRCIIFAYTPQGLELSHWMPWELGFFDGRWGPRQIGRYNLDEPHPALAKADGERQADTSSKLEYLLIYEEVTPDNLHDFLGRACSVRALADRADVDGDRLATLLVGMSRDPVNFAFDAWAYLITLQRELWRYLPASLPAGIAPPAAAQSAEPFWNGAMRANADLRGLLQPLADMMKPPEQLQRKVEALIARTRQGHEEAIAMSLPGRG